MVDFERFERGTKIFFSLMFNRSLKYVLKHVTLLKYLIHHSKFQDASQEVEINLRNLGETSIDVGLVIANSMYGCSKHDWDLPEHKWGRQDFKGVFDFAKKFGEVSNIFL